MLHDDQLQLAVLKQCKDSDFNRETYYVSLIIASSVSFSPLAYVGQNFWLAKIGRNMVCTVCTQISQI